MKISTKGRYALEAMVELATYQRDRYVSIREIAEKRNCSIKYLEQIFQLLKHKNLLISTRGKDGGYCLAKNADLICVKEIIIAVEGELEPVACLSKSCPRDSYCRAQPVWKGLQSTIYDVLERITLAELANLYSELKKKKQ